MKKLSVKSNSGQALLVILLIMAVVLTIGLSTISRSVTDIKISEQTEDSARAFSAAEAGIENYLATGGTSTSGLGTGVSVEAFPGSLLSDDFTFLYPEKITQDEVATIWLSNYDKETGLYSDLLTTSDEPIVVAWGNPGADTPALEVSLYYNNSGIKVAKFMLDPVSSRSNNFCKADADRTNCPSEISNFSTSGTVPYGGQSMRFSAEISTTGLNEMYFARLRLLYTGSTAHFIGFKSSSALPSQGDKIAATGTSNQATRKVEVYRLRAAPPDIFDFALYSGGSLTK
jgi:hypothetical protein